MHVLQPHDLSRSKLQIDRANTMNKSTRAIPHQYGPVACDLVLTHEHVMCTLDAGGDAPQLTSKETQPTA